MSFGTGEPLSGITVVSALPLALLTTDDARDPTHPSREVIVVEGRVTQVARVGLGAGGLARPILFCGRSCAGSFGRVGRRAHGGH